MKDLKEYSSATSKKVTINDFDDDYLYFINWFYQKNKRQGLGGKYIANMDRIVDLLEYGFHDQHWDDYCYEMEYQTENPSILQEIFEDCNIEIDESYVNYFDSLDNVNCDLSDDDMNALEELGLITAAFINDDLVKIYCEIFESQNIEYIVLNDTLYITDQVWGHEFIYALRNENKVVGDLEILWRGNDGMCTTFRDEKFTYFSYAEDMEGYGESFNLSQFFAELYKSDLIKFDETDILQMTFDDVSTSTKVRMFFNEILKNIEYTKEVMF